MLLALVAMPSCFGGSDQSPSERLCEVLVACGEVSAADAQECEDASREPLAEAPTRALDECLQCLEVERCSSIEDGACAEACDEVEERLDDAEVDDPPGPGGSLTVLLNDEELCPLRTWSDLAAYNSGSTYDLSAYCGDLSLDFAFPAMGIGQSKTCSDLSIYGGNLDSIFCGSLDSFTGAAMLVEKNGELWLEGSCNCIDELSGRARVTLELPLR